MKTTSPGAIPRVRLAKIAHEFGTPLGSFSQKVISRRLLGFVWPKRHHPVRTRVRLAKIARIFRTARFVCQNRRMELASLGFVRPDRALSLRSLGLDGIRGGCLGSFGQNSAYKNRLSRRRRRRGPFRCRLYEPSLPIGAFISFLPPISRSQTQPSEEEIGALCKQQEIYRDFFILGLNE